MWQESKSCHIFFCLQLLPPIGGQYKSNTLFLHYFYGMIYYKCNAKRGDNMKKVYIYQRACTGRIFYMNYTENGFSSYKQAYSYLKKISYNASCTFVSSYNLYDANRIYGGL